jgi:hypothetical protein
MRALSRTYFRKWGVYTDLMLERDWKDPQRHIYDLSFRSLLILHNTESQAALPFSPLLRREVRVR